LLVVLEPRRALLLGVARAEARLVCRKLSKG